MFELTGYLAIAGALTGSVLVALFLGETLITWIIRAMDAGVKRADAAAAKLAAQPQPSAAKMVRGQRPRLQSV